MKSKIKTRLIGWGMLIVLIIIGVFCSCEPIYLKHQLKGCYESENLILDFNDNVVFAYTNSYKIEGQFYIFSNDSVRIKIGWKKNNNEFDLSLLCRKFRYQIKGKELILQGNDFEIMLIKQK